LRKKTCDHLRLEWAAFIRSHTRPCCDNALAGGGAITGLCNPKRVSCPGRWRNLQDMDRAALGWIDGFKTRHLLCPIGKHPASRGRRKLPCTVQHVRYGRLINTARTGATDECLRASGHKAGLCPRASRESRDRPLDTSAGVDHGILLHQKRIPKDARAATALKLPAPIPS
jgi:hypothetical protein